MNEVRVTRILEYTYIDAEEALRDMDRWAVPPNGATNFNRRTQIRSAVIGPVFGHSVELSIGITEAEYPGPQA